MMRTALAGVVALGIGAVGHNALAGKAGFEKCYGVAKAGQTACSILSDRAPDADMAAVLPLLVQ